MAKTKTPRLSLAVRRIEDNLVTTRSGATWAYYVLPTRRWAFLTEGARLQSVADFATRIAQLSSHETHLRVSWKPHPVMERMAALDAATPNPLGGKYEGSLWSNYLMASARRMRKSATDDKVVYLGVKLTGRMGSQGGLAEKARLSSQKDKKRRALAAEAETVTRIVAAEGMNARPATTSEVEWLLRRSLALGLPAPSVSAVADQPWGETDLHEITDGIRAEGVAFGPTVKIVRAEDGTEGYVAVLTLGRVEDVATADPHYPWLTLPEQFPFPVEISVRLRIFDGPAASAKVSRSLLKIKDQVSHYHQHRIDPPMALDRQRRKGRRIEDEMARGQVTEASRTEGHYLFAIPGATEEQARDRADKVMDAYRRARITLVYSFGTTSAAQQYGLARSFVPGEVMPSKAHVRNAKVMFTAAGMPTVSSKLGDDRGIYWGHTLGAGRWGVQVDPYYAMEVREKSGAIVIGGDQGSGKSTILATKLIWPNVVRGNMTRVLDPAGTLASALCNLPEFRGIARNDDLLEGDDGSLSPFSIVREPKRSRFASDDDYFKAVRRAAQRRKALAIDMLTLLLPSDLSEKGDTRLVLMRAITATEARPETSLYDVVIQLEQGESDYGREIGQYLRGVSEMPQANLLFARGDTAARSDSTLLTITSMRGLVLPHPDKPRREWADSEQMAMAVFTLAAWDIMEDVYSRPMSERKMVVIDEGHALERISVGRTLVQEGTRGSRKWNLCFALATQNPEDILALGIANLVSAIFWGRTTNIDSQRAALRLLGVPEDSGYERRLGRLSPPGAEGQRSPRREFMMKDVDGRIDVIRIDAQDTPHVLRATDTTANPNDGLDDALVEEMLAGAVT